MNQENYSHILNIKVISNTSNLIVNDDILLETIKGLFLQKEQIFNGIKLNWRRTVWKGMTKYFDVGDLVIDSVFSSDEIILESVQFTLLGINMILQEQGLLFKDQQIIFKIVKPLVERTPLMDTIGIIV